MKISSLILLASLVITAPSHADSQNKMGMGQDQMNNMHSQMQKMQATMDSIHKEKDPKKQQKLINQHMSSMQKGMHGMMMGKGNKSSMMMGNGHTSGSINQRLDMMQMMMGQMMNHMEVMEKN
jgi:protein CpxP